MSIGVAVFGLVVVIVASVVVVVLVIVGVIVIVIVIVIVSASHVIARSLLLISVVDGVAIMAEDMAIGIQSTLFSTQRLHLYNNTVDAF